MSLIPIKEGTTLTRSGWLQLLGMSERDYEELLEKKILRPIEPSKIQIAFVGLVIFNKNILFAYPKFGSMRPFDLPGTLRILRHYFSRRSSRKPVKDAFRNPEFDDPRVLREYDALIQLQDWYNTHGVYQRDEPCRSPIGRPHWVRTVATQPPLLVQGSVVYPTIVASRRRGTINEISALQVGILARLLERHGLAMPHELHRDEQKMGTAVTQWPLHRDLADYFLRRIAMEQRDVFLTDSLHLLKLLCGVLERTTAAPLQEPQIFGTTAFYSVWEDACRLSLAGETEVDPASYLGQPQWVTPDPERIDESRVYQQGQIPDFVVKTRDCLFIFDAKYYHPFPDSRPGGPDIVKQIYYAEALKDEQLCVRSIFVLPCTGQEIPLFLGCAEIGGSRRKFPNVEAWGVDPAVLFAEYPSTSPHRTKFMLKAFIDGGDKVAEVLGKSPSIVCR